MSAEIRTLKDKDIQVLPRTRADAVSTTDGSTVQDKINNILEEIENISVSSGVSQEYVDNLCKNIVKYAAEKIITIDMDTSLSLSYGGKFLDEQPVHIKLVPVDLPDEYGVITSYMFPNSLLDYMYLPDTATAITPFTVTISPPANYWLGYPGTTGNLRFVTVKTDGTGKKVYTGRVGEKGELIYSNVSIGSGQTLQYYLSNDNNGTYQDNLLITPMLN